MKEIYLPSTDKKNRLHIVIWEPECKIRGIVQLSHGMIEYVKRYDAFARFLNKNGFLVIGNDHLGHGETVKSTDDFGYFCEHDMSRTVVNDLHEVTCFAKKEYPKVPYFLFGHSMGSFMARRYIMSYGHELSGAILCGTGNQPVILLKAAQIITSLIKLCKGDRARSMLLEILFFAKYNKRIKHRKTNSDWLTKDSDIIEQYRGDKYCSYTFTVNGYRTLLEVLSFIQNPKNIKKIPANLPISLIAGTEDPVGDYGKAVKYVFETYRKNGLQDVSLKLYENDRHELLNETDKEAVYGDILEWLNGRIFSYDK